MTVSKSYQELGNKLYIDHNIIFMVRHCHLYLFLYFVLARLFEFRNLYILYFTISNLAKLDFMALDISGKNYLSWVLDAETHLNANGLGDAIKEKNNTSSQDKPKA